MIAFDPPRCLAYSRRFLMQGANAMEQLWPFLGILAALTVGVVSPGPSFVMVARTAVARSRADALAAALGMGAGGVVFAALALMGLRGVLLAVPSLYVALKVGGGLYLAYLGLRIYRAARSPLAVAATPGGHRGPTWGKSLALGFTTQISNPKTAIVYASVFAAFMPKEVSAGFAAALLALVYLVEAGWYAAVAMGLSSRGPREAYLRGKAWIDRLAGSVLVVLGLRLVATAHRA